MTMSFTRETYFFMIGCIFSSYAAWAQDNLTGFWEPVIAINYKVKNNYKHNFSLAKRSFMYRDSDLQLTTRQLDFVHFSDFKIKDNQNIAFGIQYRLRENFDTSGSNELRLSQQYNSTKRTGKIRLGNRIRAEQRITDKPTIHRFRYRFALDFPLQGESLDVGEAYAVLSTESLLSIGRALLPEYDQRVEAQIGWLLNNGAKIQLGTQWRAENCTNETECVFFLVSALVLSL